jgi:hypothetical protein
LAVAKGFAAIGEGFGDVQTADTIGSVKVSERARHAQDAVEAACGELHRFGSLAQERETSKALSVMWLNTPDHSFSGSSALQRCVAA